MVRKIFLAIILISLSPIFFHLSYAQILYQNTGHIPKINQLSWANAGLTVDRQFYADHLLDVTKFGATKDNDSNDDGEGIIAAIDSAKKLEGLSIIYFPKGSYLIKQPIIIEYDDSTGWNGNILFQGAGSDSTFLNFQFNNPNLDCFYIKGEQIGTDDDGYIELTQDIPKDSKGLHANSFSSVDDSSWIRLSEYGFSVADPWAEGSVGQITRIYLDAADSSYAEMEDPASKEYLASNDLRVWQIHPVENIGFESLKIRRYDGKSTSSNHGHNIKLEYAVNCWIRGIEFSNTSKHHVEVEFSSHIEISGCYFHHAESYGGGGYGYGVILQLSTTNCLVENNVFVYLRHAMLVQAGANCNVFEFNYSTDQHWTGENLSHGPDLCLHGNYPYGNLYEQNFVEEITADDPHGNNGLNNAFIRNRVHFEGESTDRPITLYSAPRTAVEGCQLGISDQPPYQPIVLEGNSNLSLDLYGYYACNLSEERTHLDVYQDGSRKDCCNQDVSYFYSEAPYFLESFSFPSIGPKPTSDDAYPPQDIPARYRYKYNSPITYIHYETKHPKNVKVDQKDSNLNSFGLISHWEKINGSYAWKYTVAPYTYEFRLQSDQVIKAEQDLHNNNEKFNNWNNNDFLLNHNIFTINSKLTNLTAYFDHVSNIFVKSELGNYGSYNTVKLKDPWYRDFDEQPYGIRNQGMAAPPLEIPAPYIVSVDSTRQGVFLNQSYTGQNAVYYSVKAEEQQTFRAHGQDITGYFLSWEGTDVNFQFPDSLETPVVFQADSAEARAVYKGHLASSMARATGYNNGRRMAKDGSGKLHLVYEDDGKIWYTTSTSNGYKWNKDEKIPVNYGPVHNPSIAVTNGQPGEGVHVHVVWERDVVNSDWQIIRIICYSEKTSSGWSNPIILSEGTFSPAGFWTGSDCRRPTIIGEGSDYLFVAWKSGNRIKIINHSDGIWSNVTTVPGAYDGYPVIGRTYSGTRKTKIIWSDDGDIRYIEGDYLGNNSWSWSGIKSLTSNFNSVIYSNYEPTMDIAPDGKGYVAWEAVSVSSGNRGVYFCKYDMYNNASQAWYLTLIDQDYGNHLYPSINWDNQQNKCTLVYQKANHIHYKTNNYNSSTWSGADYGPGYYPNLPSEDNPVPIWTTYNSAPYLLKTYILNSYLAKNTISEVREYKRFIFPTDMDSTYLTANLKYFSYNDQALSFGPKLRSRSIRIDNEGLFKYRIELDSLKANVNRERIRFWFVSGDEKYLLDQVELTGEEKENTLDRSVTFDAGKAKEGYVQIDFPDSQPFVINVVPEDNSGSGLAKVAVAPEANPFVPKTFRLNQNFPNPFNPTTQIVFDLPQEAKVTLEIFDINGHKIATLAEGQKAAGRYHVVFDGQNLASGVYIYRLTTDKGFVQSKKMMLIR